jgi:hypothetical protein
VRDGDSASPKNSVNVKAVAATADDRAGVIRIWEVSCGLNATLVRFGTGRGVEEHVSDGIEVIVAGSSGSGIIREDRGERVIAAGVLAFIPKGALCATVSTSEGFAYPAVRCRRRSLHIDHQAGRVASESAHIEGML